MPRLRQLELVLAVIARLLPFDLHLAASVAVVIAGLVALAVDIVRVRPTLAEAALAVDSEDGLNDRVSTALSLAASKPELASAESSDAADANADTRTQPSTNTLSACSAATR